LVQAGSFTVFAQVSDNDVDTLRLSRGQIVERWGIIDSITMMHQISAIT
jgi:hypothetical protein